MEKPPSTMCDSECPPASPDLCHSSGIVHLEHQCLAMDQVLKGHGVLVCHLQFQNIWNYTCCPKFKLSLSLISQKVCSPAPLPGICYDRDISLKVANGSLAGSPVLSTTTDLSLVRLCRSLCTVQCTPGPETLLWKGHIFHCAHLTTGETNTMASITTRQCKTVKENALRGCGFRFSGVFS